MTPGQVFLAATAFVVNITYHIKLQYTPRQLVLVHDMVLNNPSINDWEYIRRCKPSQKIKITKIKMQISNGLTIECVIKHQYAIKRQENLRSRTKAPTKLPKSWIMGMSPYAGAPWNNAYIFHRLNPLMINNQIDIVLVTLN